MADVKIEARPNGPYVVTGSIELRDTNGMSWQLRRGRCSVAAVHPPKSRSVTVQKYERGANRIGASRLHGFRLVISRKNGLDLRRNCEHCRNKVEASDAGVHFHRLVKAIGVGGRIAAPAAFTHHDRREVQVEGGMSGPRSAYNLSFFRGLR
jgi:hypothetical protein